MPKPWLDLVTHRLQLRAIPPAPQASGAKDGSGDGVDCDYSADPTMYLARWQTPEEGPVMRWTVEDDAIRLI